MSGRHDLWVRALDGPTAGQEVRGKGLDNVVSFGKAPPPGGVAIPLRSLAPVHVRVQITDGQAAVVPLGSHPVRIAPHANVDWTRVDPLTAPAWWNPGGVMYLGRPGGGVALELVRVQALGEWEGGATQSAVSPGAPVKVRPSRLPLVGMGCGVIGVGLALAVALAIVIVALIPEPDVLPRPGKAVVYEFAEPKASTLARSPSGLRDLEGAWQRLHVEPSAAVAEAAGRDMTERRARESWDEAAFVHFVASAEKHASSQAFYARVETVKEEYATVLEALARAELPEALAAIPMTESQYRPHASSIVCAHGWWQFMPEVANRVGVRVQDCTITSISGNEFTWTPTLPVPARGASNPYIDLTDRLPSCRIRDCAIDERDDLEASTAGAIRALEEPWNDVEIQASGAAVALTILSHNAGYWDGRFDVRRPTNVRPAYRRWKRGKAESDWHRFYGENLTCPGGHDELEHTCDGELVAQSQHYAYTVLAQHLVAMCYLGQNHADTPAFLGWADTALDEDGPCGRFRIPRPSELR